MTEQEIKAALFSFHSANERLLSAFLVYCQAVEYEADQGTDDQSGSEPSLIDTQVADEQVEEIMRYLEKGGQDE